jgi:hypothetical protein
MVALPPAFSRITPSQPVCRSIVAAEQEVTDFTDGTDEASHRGSDHPAKGPSLAPQSRQSSALETHLTRE